MKKRGEQGLSHGSYERGIAIRFFFDPLCPWTYRTSLWAREVRRQVGGEIRWCFFSLEEINRKPGEKPPWEKEWSPSWGIMRVGALLRRKSLDLLDEWYLRVGAAIHEEGVGIDEPAAAEAIAERMGLGAAVVEEALCDPSTSEAVRADHEEAVEKYGAFGVPTLVVEGGDVVFGPVISEVPRGEAALRLWRLTADWLAFPGLYELKRPLREEH